MKVSASRSEAEKDNVVVPLTLEDYCIKTKAPVVESTLDMADFYDDDYDLDDDDDVEYADDDDEAEEDGEDSGNDNSWSRFVSIFHPPLLDRFFPAALISTSVLLTITIILNKKKMKFKANYSRTTRRIDSNWFLLFFLLVIDPLWFLIFDFRLSVVLAAYCPLI